MTTTAPASPLRAIALVGEVVFIQLTRRKDAYVLLILGALFLLGVLTVNLVGIENPATGTFILNLGLMMAWLFSHILTLLLTARQIPDEVDQRTLYPLLAKPLDRTSLLVGKWVACTLCGFGIYILLLLLGWLPAPKMESYHSIMLVQAVVVQFFSLGVLAAITLFLSLVLPRGVSLVCAGLIFGFGSNITGFISARFLAAEAHTFVEWLLAYVPDFGKFNLSTRYTDGIDPLGPGGFFGLCVHASILILFFLFLSAAAFKRRAL